MIHKHVRPAPESDRPSEARFPAEPSEHSPDPVAPQGAQRMADWIRAYRLSAGDPSRMLSAALAAHPGAERADIVAGMMLANRLERRSAHG